MVHYKLSYFNVKGRGEPIRIIFAYLRIPYEDHQIDLKNWAEWKLKFPWGHVPVLQVDGVAICQSLTIARFLTRRHGLAGVNEIEAAKCDECVDAINDLQGEWRKWRNLKDDSDLIKAKSDFLQVHVPKYLNKFSSIQSGNIESPWLVGTSITWADLIVAAYLDAFEHLVDLNLLDTYPVMKDLKERVFLIPQIKQYLDGRPNTPYSTARSVIHLKIK